MTTATRIPTRQEMYAAQATLKAAGWTHTSTLMHADADQEFGLRYERGTERFWLNLHTIANLPK